MTSLVTFFVLFTTGFSAVAQSKGNHTTVKGPEFTFESSSLLSQLDSKGIKSFICEISGRPVKEKFKGMEGLGDTTRLLPRTVFASNTDEALKLCLSSVGAHKGGIQLASRYLYLVLIDDTQELKSLNTSLFIVDDVKIND